MKEVIQDRLVVEKIQRERYSGPERERSFGIGYYARLFRELCADRAEKYYNGGPVLDI